MTSRSWAYRHHEPERQLMIPAKMSLLSQPGLQGAVNRYQSSRSKDESTLIIIRWNTLSSIKSESVSESLIISRCIFPTPVTQWTLSGRDSDSHFSVSVNSVSLRAAWPGPCSLLQRPAHCSGHRLQQSRCSHNKIDTAALQTASRHRESDIVYPCLSAPRTRDTWHEHVPKWPGHGRVPGWGRLRGARAL